MAKEYQFNWRSNIPATLLQGSYFDRYDDESTCLDLNAHFRVDEYGFFLYWACEGRDAVVLDLIQVWEARRAGLPKDGRVMFELEQRGPRETLEERTVWITHGVDLVNVSSFYIVAQDVETAKIWRNGLNELLKNTKMRHISYSTCLMKNWRYLCLSLNDRRKIPIKNIVKMFASGKTDKMVQKCLSDLGLSGNKYTIPYVINRPFGRKVRTFYRCNTRKKRKEREELDVELFTFDKFLRLYHKICPRSDVQELFVKLSGQKEYLTKDRLINFLNEEQRDPRLNEILFPFFDNNRVQQLIAKYEIDETYVNNGKMSGDAFLRFLMSDENAPVFLDRVELYQDMDQPLCHYYINSSHNTYLTGRQYGGKSSTEIYRQVLLTGCRCIELDCWDGTGENKGEPIITHGKAMCTDVFFKDVLYQIRDTAFARSDYPVILSFENHCSKSNQHKMAKYCMEIFGEMLLSRPLDDNPLEPGVPLPSPNHLKRKILIKNKRLKADIEKLQMEQFLREGKLDEEDEQTETPEVVIGEDASSPPSGDQRAHPEAEQRDGQSSPSRGGDTMQLKEADEAHPELKQSNFMAKLKPLGFTKKPQLGMTETSSDHLLPVATATSFRNKRSFRRNTRASEMEGASLSAALLDPQPQRSSSARHKIKKPFLTKEEEERIFAEYHYTGATTNIHPLLSSLVNYTHPVKFSGFDVAEMNNLHFHMSSFSESTGLGYLKQSAPEFVNYNKRQLSRIYPKGARVDSSNFLPQIFWNAGCQMVALNFQTPDVYMQLNMGKFEYNGCCGYLLKPDFMRRPDRTFDPFSESPVDGVIAAHCSVKVISGHFLCDRKVGTYVEVEMYGLPTDTIRKEHRTRTVPANGLNPVYNSDPFVFRKVVLPELAVLRFAVYDESGKQLGQRILPLDGLQAGYRHITLRTESNLTMILPALFVHIVIKTYVPDELSGLVDALADPRAYLSAQEKRKEALHNMGVDDADILEVPSNKSTASKSNLLRVNGSATNHSGDLTKSPLIPQKDLLSTTKQTADSNDNKQKVEMISVAELKKDKCFVKLTKKLQKDLDDLKRRHQKQRDSIQKQQQSNVEKLICDSHKQSKKRIGGNSLNQSRHASLSTRQSDPASLAPDMANSHQMRSLVMTQTDEWSAMVRRHETECYELKRAHIREEFDLLNKLLVDAQKQQMAALKLRLEAENKELKQTQTKKSMDDARAIQQDKSIKTKAEKDRRVKEMNEKNLKMFFEERKRLAIKSQKHEEQLSKRHQEQCEALERDALKALEQEEMNYREAQLASRPESVC
uniref:1-phosphatidylinositol 4,5-bisphosphate phosphodiesterase n=1 Tax=Ascaris suum TaxID=6253 RepID=F1KQQ6_ASCSU